MKRNLVRRRVGLLALIVLVLTSLLRVPLATANNAAVFDMSAAAVRAGQAVKLTEIDSCPAPDPLSWGRYVEASFIDANSERSLWSALTDEQGHWSEPILPSPAHGRVASFDPLSYSSDAAHGAGIVEVRCVEDGVITLEYESQVLAVNGPSAGFTVSPGPIKTGHLVHLESVMPCPSGSASVDGWMNGYNMSWHVYQGTLDGNGNWSIDFTLPTDFPEGHASFNAFCRPPGKHYGKRTQAYHETFAAITAGEFNYLAWGDSYSSGEGVEPFEAGTESQGGCHRSTDSYARVLERDSSLRLRLGNGFVACSGATTAGITLGDGTNPAQIDTLTADTDLVTLTVGGNNMDFRAFALSCALPLQGDACSGSAFDAAMAKIVSDVIPAVEYMLGTIRDRLITLDNTDATVLVLGYPQLIPETWQYYHDGCWWLQPDETPAIREVTSTLNTAIKNEVDAIGYDFHFISATDQGSPFIGHELCRDTSETAPTYFNNVVLGGPEAYPFHPNKAGHEEGYAVLVKNWLAAHPLS